MLSFMIHKRANNLWILHLLLWGVGPMAALPIFPNLGEFAGAIPGWVELVVLLMHVDVYISFFKIVAGY